MKKPMLQERTIQDAIAFWQQLRHGQFRPLFAEPTENTVTQLFRYVLTGASSFLVDFLLLFLLEEFHRCLEGVLQFLLVHLVLGFALLYRFLEISKLFLVAPIILYDNIRF